MHIIFVIKDIFCAVDPQHLSGCLYGLPGLAGCDINHETTYNVIYTSPPRINRWY